MGALNKTGNGLDFIVWDEVLSADPTTITDHPQLYFKSDGLYYKDGAGTITGPLGAGGGGGDAVYVSLDTYPSPGDNVGAGHPIGQLWSKQDEGRLWWYVSGEETALWVELAQNSKVNHTPDIHIDTVDPTVDNDYVHSFRTGQLWFNTVTHVYWKLGDMTDGAAQWHPEASAVWSGTRPIPGVDGIDTGLPKGTTWFWDGEKIGFMQTDSNFWTPITVFYSDHDPGQYQDEAHGFYKGQRWMNTAAQKEWLLWDQTTDAADWKQVGSGSGSVIQQQISDRIGTANYKTKLARIEGGSIATLDTVTLLDQGGSGTLLALWSAVSSGSGIEDVQFKIYVDGEVSPSVVFDFAQIGLMHLDADGEYWTEHTRVQYTTSGGGLASMTFQYPIPFSSGIRVDIYNPTGGSVGIFGQAFWTPDITDSRRLKSSGRTHSDMVSITVGDPDYAMLSASGNPGTIVFHSVGITDATTNGYLESDMTLYVDGEGSPSISSTGTEDWFQSGWYYGGFARSTPIANTSFVDLTSHNTMQSLDLLQLMGGIYFSDSVDFYMSLNETDTNFSMAYLVLYYEGQAAHVDSYHEAAADPDETQDNTKGFDTTSRWFNTVTKELFVLLDEATGAAVWAQGSGPRLLSTDISNPPTLSELNTIWDATANAGIPLYQIIINDNGDATNIYLCTALDGIWTYTSLTLAV